MKKIPLTRGKYAMVDDEDYPYLSRFTWHCSSEISGSERAELAIRVEKKVVDILMERFLIDIPKNNYCYMILHKDKNGLNNQKDNLFLGFTGQKNQWQKKQGMRNGKKYTSIYKGVCRNKKNGKPTNWRAYISLNTNIKEKKKQIKLGNFETEKEAAIVYNKRAKELYGEFAYQNKI